MGVKMGEPEKNYYLNRKDTSISRTSEKKMVCFPEKNDLDETWVKQQERRQKLDKYQEKQLGESSHSFDTATLNSVSLEEDFESDATRSSQ